MVKCSPTIGSVTLPLSHILRTVWPLLATSACALSELPLSRVTSTVSQLHCAEESWFIAIEDFVTLLYFDDTMLSLVGETIRRLTDPLIRVVRHLVEAFSVRWIVTISQLTLSFELTASRTELFVVECLGVGGRRLHHLLLLLKLSECIVQVLTTSVLKRILCSSPTWFLQVV